MRDLMSRIFRLERDSLLPPDGTEPMLLRVHGGVPGMPRATIGERTVAQFPGEPLPDFIDRCFDVATDEGAAFIVLRGLTE